MDYALVHGMNHAARRSVLFDYAMTALSRAMFSNLCIVSLVWYAWFSTEDVEVRSGVLVGVAASFAAGVLSRFLQLT